MPITHSCAHIIVLRKLNAFHKYGDGVFAVMGLVKGIVTWQNLCIYVIYQF